MMLVRRPGRYDPALDGLRAVAILLVMLHHFGYTPDISIAGRALAAIAAPEWIGVDLFFVLSGFLITGICLDHRGPGFFRAFYLRRAMRILPPYSLVLAAVLGAAVVTMPVVHGGIALATFTSNIAIAAAGDWRAVPTAARHFWSLAVEEQFYLLWPWIAASWASRRVARAALAAIPFAIVARTAFLAAGVSPLAGYILMPARVDALAIGALLAVAMRDHAWQAAIARTVRPIAEARVAYWVAALIVLLLAITASTGGGEPYGLGMQTVGLTALAMIGGVVVASVSFSGGDTPLRRALSQPAVVTIGKYSYAMYLIHVPVNVALRNIGFAPSNAAEATMFTIAGSAATFVLAASSWYFVEAPALSLKRFAPYGRERLAIGVAGAVADAPDHGVVR